MRLLHLYYILWAQMLGLIALAFSLYGFVGVALVIATAINCVFMAIAKAQYDEAHTFAETQANRSPYR